MTVTTAIVSHTTDDPHAAGDDSGRSPIGDRSRTADRYRPGSRSQEVPARE